MGNWRRVPATLGSMVRTVLNQGVSPQLSPPLVKRVRLANALSLFGSAFMLASIPFDHLNGPAWLVLEDLIGGLAFFCFPLLNRAGLLVTSRLLCLALFNLLVLGNAIFLGHESGTEVVFVALAAVPFTLFDMDERAPLLAGVGFAVGSLMVAHFGVFQAYTSLATDSLKSYHLYSVVMALAVVLFSASQVSRANARAERALRQDVAERLRAEKELSETRQNAVYAAKMAALGEMSGNIAHEVNNPLAAMLLRAQRLGRLAARSDLDCTSLAKEAAGIESLVHRIRRIVDSLRSFARDAEKDPLRPERAAAIVNETIDLCAQRFRQHDIALHVDPIPDDLYVLCRGVQVSQVLLNLLGNAHDAVERHPVRWVRVTVEPRGDEVRIAVADSGPGVPRGLEGRIMEPFFTTKEIGKGTGLGLSVSKGIAEAHGGALVLDRHSPETRFVLSLRRAFPSEKALDPDGPRAVP